MSLSKGELRKKTRTEERTCENRERWPSVSQVERSQKKSSLPILRCQTSSLQNYEKNTFLYFKPASVWCFVMAVLAN